MQIKILFENQIKTLVANARCRGFKSFREQKSFLCNFNFQKEFLFALAKINSWLIRESLPIVWLIRAGAFVEIKCF